MTTAKMFLLLLLKMLLQVHRSSLNLMTLQLFRSHREVRVIRNPWQVDTIPCQNTSPGCPGASAFQKTTDSPCSVVFPMIPFREICLHHFFLGQLSLFQQRKTLCTKSLRNGCGGKTQLSLI